MIQRIFRAFGTINTISVYDNDDKGAVLTEAEAMLMDMNNCRSVFSDKSEISLINSKAGQELIAIMIF